MKKLAVIFLLLISFKINSQSKLETEDWIISKLEYYSFQNPPHTIVKVKIINGQIIFYNSYGWFQSIYLKDINQVLVEHKDSNENVYGVTLFCKNKNSCVTDGEYDGNILSPLKEKNNRMMFLFLREEFGQKDLPKRMEKAILHLIKLYGGNPKVYKETF